MEYQTFSQLMEIAKKKQRKSRMVVVAAGETHALEAALEAEEQGIETPIFVGNHGIIAKELEELGKKPASYEILDKSDNEGAAQLAVSMVRAKQADFILKGNLDTKVLLHAVVDKNYGLGTGRTMSHFAIFEIPGARKLLVAVDGGMVPYPTLEQKKDIILNTVGVLHTFGYECPKVGVLACVEKVNPKMPETVEAAALKEMQLPGCIVEGPISYDCAMSKEIADLKGFQSPCAGDCDVLLAPNIHAGNIMGKMLTVTCKAKLAGFIVGAKCPIIVPSRGSTAEEKYFSIVLSALAEEGLS